MMVNNWSSPSLAAAATWARTSTVCGRSLSLLLICKRPPLKLGLAVKLTLTLWLSPAATLSTVGSTTNWPSPVGLLISLTDKMPLPVLWINSCFWLTSPA